MMKSESWLKISLTVVSHAGRQKMLSVKRIKHIQRTWVISLLQILFTKFPTVKELIIYQLSLQLKMSSYLKSIVGIMFFLKPLHDSTDKNILHWQSFKLFQDRKHLSQLCAPLRQRLKKNPVPWNEEHTKIVKTVKSRVKTLPCLALANPEAFKIVEIDASDIGYGGILKPIYGD